MIKEEKEIMIVQKTDIVREESVLRRIEDIKGVKKQADLAATVEEEIVEIEIENQDRIEIEKKGKKKTYFGVTRANIFCRHRRDRSSSSSRSRSKDRKHSKKSHKRERSREKREAKNGEGQQHSEVNY